MTCTHCRKKLTPGRTKCPFCGKQLAEAWSGVFQTSAVFISAGKTEAVYRSVQDVPDALRTKLLKTTNGRNSATILIADRGGRQQIAKAMRNLPGAAGRGSYPTTGRQARSGFREPASPEQRGTAVARIATRTKKELATDDALATSNQLSAFS